MDLNADLGESFGTWTLGDDAALLAHVSSANVACGFHAGDPLVMRHTVRLAAAHGVVIGAHPGYRDLAGFGRRALDASPDEIAAETMYQLGALEAICRAEGTRVRYVKPHGALYNRAAVDVGAAAAIASAIAAVDPSLMLLALAGSALLDAGRAAGLRVAAEGFADRAYLPDGRLAPRTMPGALLADPDEVAARALALAKDGRVAAIDGTMLSIAVDSLCIHGDAPGAAALAAAVRHRLTSGGITVAPFVA